ncbi:molecular chaperone DnaJ [Vibrio cyclitrophicus 1F175]|uniref:J domain-containing protein n=1 Tax=Vibrio cyclitrophicus TaxID=47951 RepID=UPI0002EEF66B|nr:J domain-containing protein [Vibrio cyclitrophicus]OEF63552.1 molecular chaperone DnaJ [Vibrio cyclitrophicus 1F175]
MYINDALNLLSLTGSATQTEIKKAYKAACLKFHPDRNPAGAQMMIAINAAYDFLKGLEGNVEAKEGFEANDYADELNEVLNRLFGLEGIEIEVCGNWVWVTGETKAHKDVLGRKDGGIGCYFSRKKSAWYYRPAEYKSFSRKSHDMDDIRAKYGSTKPGRKTLAA